VIRIKCITHRRQCRNLVALCMMAWVRRLSQTQISHGVSDASPMAATELILLVIRAACSTRPTSSWVASAVYHEIIMHSHCNAPLGCQILVKTTTLHALK
jgi:hypothetical protein